MTFDLLKLDSSTAARRGRLTTGHGTVETPVFIPCGTQATVKALTPHELREEGVELVLCNTYHLYLRPGCSVASPRGTKRPRSGKALYVSYAPALTRAHHLGTNRCGPWPHRGPFGGKRLSHSLIYPGIPGRPLPGICMLNPEMPFHSGL